MKSKIEKILYKHIERVGLYEGGVITCVDENEFDEIAQEIVKLFAIPVVSNNEVFELCDGVAFANYIEEKWKEYRTITNNEDAWCFKQWLVEK